MHLKPDSRLLYFLLFTFLLPLLSFAEEEKLFCILDDREWKIGYQEHDVESSLTELVPSSQNILTWTEMFTVQVFRDKDLTDELFMAAFKVALKQHTPEHQELIYHVYDPELHILETSFVAKEEKESEVRRIMHNEFNIGRILKGNQSLYYIRYSATDAKTFEQNKEAWIARLKQAYTASDAKENQQGAWFTFSSEGVEKNSTLLPYQPEEVTYIDTKAGYTIGLPQDWLYNNEWSEEEKGEGGVKGKRRYIETLIFTDPAKTIMGHVLFKEKTKNEETSEQFRNRYIRFYQKQGKEFKIIEQGEIQTALGDTGHYVIFADQDQQGWINFFEKEGRIFRLDLFAPKDKFESVKGLFEALAINFHLLEADEREEDVEEEEEIEAIQVQNSAA
jgi:hypothetical protein